MACASSDYGCQFSAYLQAFSDWAVMHPIGAAIGVLAVLMVIFGHIGVKIIGVIILVIEVAWYVGIPQLGIPPYLGWG